MLIVIVDIETYYTVTIKPTCFLRRSEAPMNEVRFLGQSILVN